MESGGGRGKEKKERIFYSYRVSLLLNLQDGAILECPLDNVGVWAGALDKVARLEVAPEVAEVFELDLVPDIGELGLDDGRLGDGRGSWD